MGFQLIELEVGRFYTINNRVYEFRKSTPKGYNFFDFITEKKLYKRHVYPFRKPENTHFIFPRGIVIKPAKNPWDDVDLMKKYHEHRSEINITPDIMESIGIDVDTNGNII